MKRWWSGKRRPAKRPIFEPVSQTENGQPGVVVDSPADTSPATNLPQKPDGCTCDPVLLKVGDTDVFIHYGTCGIGHDRFAKRYSELLAERSN